MTRFAREAVLALACAVALAGLLVGGAAHAQIFLPQPYLVYEVPPQPLVPTPVVDLEDQFNLWRDVSVLDRWFHMNPVDKIPISPPGSPELRTDFDLHYRWFPIDIQSQGTRIVQVTNQFADQEEWTIDCHPEFLLAPASKIIGPGEPGPPPPGQHYDCFEVLAAPPMPLTVVDLNDQFGPHDFTDVLDPRYLCAPAEKTNGPAVYPIFEAADGRDHLACYDLFGDEWLELISTRDQFSVLPWDENVTDREVMLCVPSTKTYDRVPSLASWGIATLGLSMLLTVFAVAHRRARHGRRA
jgi:hypothetical protein